VANGVSWNDFALHAHLCKKNMVLAGKRLGHVERTGASGFGAFHDVEANHCRGYVRMAEQILDSSDVDAAFQEMSGKAMAKGMAGCRLGESGLAHGLFELALHGDFVDVVSGNSAGPRMGAKCCGGKEKLPGPFAGGVGVL